MCVTSSSGSGRVWKINIADVINKSHVRARARATRRRLGIHLPRFVRWLLINRAEYTSESVKRLGKRSLRSTRTARVHTGCHVPIVSWRRQFVLFDQSGFATEVFRLIYLRSRKETVNRISIVVERERERKNAQRTPYIEVHRCSDHRCEHVTEVSASSECVNVYECTLCASFSCFFIYFFARARELAAQAPNPPSMCPRVIR